MDIIELKNQVEKQIILICFGINGFFGITKGRRN